MSYAEPGQPAQQIMGVAATADFLNLLGVQPSLGRNFAADEDQPGKSKVVLRGQVAPEALVRPVSRTVRALDADLPVSEAGALRTGPPGSTPSTPCAQTRRDCLS